MKTIELFARLTLTAALSTALVACGGAPVEADESGDDAITVGPVGTGPVVGHADPCSVQSPDDVEVLSANDPFDIAESGDAAYANRSGCTRFIADFYVPPSASPPQFYARDFLVNAQTFPMLTSQSDCENTTITVRRYRRSASASSLALESTATYRGHYTPGGPGLFSVCSTVLTAGDEPVWRNVNPAGTEIYRIAVRATKNGTAVPVSAAIVFQAQPH